MVQDTAKASGRKTGPVGPIDVEVLALRALAFLATDEETLGPFLSATGLDLAGVRASASDPGFQRGLLSYLITNEDLLVRFATAQKLNPDEVGRAVLAMLDTPERSYDIRAR